MKGTIAILALGVTLSAMFVTQTASADDDVARARQTFARGMSQARKNELEDARRSFAAAYALVPSVDILWNLAMTERGLDRHVEALGHLRLYVASQTARADRKQLAEAELIPELVVATGHLSVHAPEGAVIEVDGVAVASPVLDVEPGVHAVGITFGALKEARIVNVAAAIETKVDFAFSASKFVKTPAPPPVEPPLRTIAPEEPASPKTSTTPRPGDTHAHERARMWTLLGLGGAAVVSAAGGVVFASMGAADRAEAERLYTKIRDGGESCATGGSICPDHDRASAAANRENAAATTFFVASGVFAGATVAAWLLWPSADEHAEPRADHRTQPPSARARVLPAVGVNGASVTLHATF